jgi:hypothetical protein
MNMREKILELEERIDGLTDRAIEQGYVEGRAYERGRTLKVLRGRQCFDFSSGMCEHSACYLVEEVVKDLNKNE